MRMYFSDSKGLDVSDFPMVDETLTALAEGNPERVHLLAALRLQGDDQERLYELARIQRNRMFPSEEVEVRSVMEISNICNQTCHYCSMAKGSGLKRYVLKESDVQTIVRVLYASGRRVLLVQSGENASRKFIDFIAKMTSQIRTECPEMEVILCLGNLTKEEYIQLREAGGTRYILKHETANPELYHRVKPADTLPRRLECLELLLEIGFHVGSGNIVGLPGQTPDDLVDDLLLLGRYPLAMSSTTVFIPGEMCDFRNEAPGNIETTFNFLALIRILYPDRLIPSTSSLERGKMKGQYTGLMAGANTVTVHDATPSDIKELFPIYSTHRIVPTSVHLMHAVENAGLKPAIKGLIHDNYRSA